MIVCVSPADRVRLPAETNGGETENDRSDPGTAEEEEEEV